MTIHNNNEALMVQLRKYPNRRLYDPNQSRYVTIADVQQYLQAGQQVRVETYAKGHSPRDITLETLWDVLRAKEIDQPSMGVEDVRKLILGGV